jgi:hypothetical protein
LPGYGPNGEPLPLGSTVPRIFTPPLVEGPPGPCGCGCALDPSTSFGFAFYDFTETVIRRPLDPWQRWLAIHAGELNPDGSPRFRHVLVLVARQNGKTALLVALVLYWLFVELHPLVLGTSSKLDYAKEAWEAALKLAERSPALAPEIPTRNGVRRANGEQTLTTVDDCRYKIAAANDDAGRSMTVNKLILDELRQHFSWNAYNAATPTQNAVWDGQAWFLSNQGDHRSIVLHALRRSAITHLKEGNGDPLLGIFEWSAPDGSVPDDVGALAQANPNVGRRVIWGALLGAARRVMQPEAKPEELAGFKIENMCMEIDQLDPAINLAAWMRCHKGSSLDDWRDRIALCFDVSLDGLHATVCAGARRDDGVVVVDSVAAFEGPNSAAQLRKALPGIVARVKPRRVSYFPNGPAAVMCVEMTKRKRRPGEGVWPPRGVELAEIRGEASAACMGFATLVNAEQISHSNDPLITAHVTSADKLKIAETWRFTRVKAGQCDGAYAAAGAAHEAQTVTPRTPARLVSSNKGRGDA